MKDLKLWLSLNAGFSGTSGLLLMFGNEYLQQLMGFQNGFLLPMIGIGLLIFCIYLIFVIIRKADDYPTVLSVSLADAGWVLGSLIIVVFQLFGLSNAGYLIIAVVAIVVAIFAVQQYRHNQRPQSSRS